ncbi:MAG TPA: PAS domain-containing methyl-accepting chemotaxis protein, partial [Accumulibacter sp.]|nr:PAS domain-containing methyl-accepting chemotaxis protein [Accumulibacter sp.]
MRNNQPVTRHESIIPEGEFIYSRTDLKGIIEEANEAFARISGFTREEMIGQPHNIVRHPDMPAEAFADLWADLKAGMPWRGLVKNRRKDGGYYWVIANAAPIRENGRVVGYQSVRVRPTREEINVAEDAYRRIRQGDQRIRIEHGRVVRLLPSMVHSFTSLPIQMNLIGVLALLSVFGNLLSAQFDSNIVTSTHHVLNAITGIYALYFLFGFVPVSLRDLRATADHLQIILATGDMKTRLSIEREDVIGRIARLADRFISSVRATVQGMSDTSRQVEKANHEVCQGVANVNRAAIVQSEATAAAAVAVEQVTVSISEVAKRAMDTEQAAQRAGEVARSGDELSMRASKTIHSLAETVKGSAQRVETLGQRSEEISRIVAVIKEVADQTNLLALNAAI